MTTPAPTSIDVARHAGVSQSTVSLVLSGKAEKRISPATAERVRAAARELGYRPNAAARALRSGTTRAVGLVVPDAAHPFMGRVLRGAQRAASAEGYAVALVDAGDGQRWEEESVAALTRGQVDGFLVFGAPPAVLLEGDPPPMVLIEGERRGLPSVRFDSEGGTDAAMAHLAELGHRRIGHLRSVRDEDTFRRRVRRWRAGLEALGVDPVDVPSAPTLLNIPEATEAAHALLAEPTGRPTAVLCDDDLAAAGVYAAVRDLGLSIPGELSVVGFDDLQFAAVLTPPLTTVRLDAEGLGERALRTLVAGLEGRDAPARSVLPFELVVRASTGPPRR